MTSRPQALFCDVDRTLLTHGHVLLPDVARAVRDADDAGIRVIFASARSPRGVQHVRERLEIDGPAICFNGAWIGEPDLPRPWQTLGIARTAALEAVRCAVAGGLVPLWYSDSAVQSLARFEAVASRQAAITRDQIALVSEPDDFADDPLKVMVVVAPDRIDDALRRLDAACGATVAVVRSGPGLIEIVRTGVNKAQAAKAVADRLGLRAQDCAAVGDSENDIEMLRWAGMPLTVRNGVAEAREIARFVGGHCDEGGLAEVIGWLLSQPQDAREPHS